jgi:hypothetical protein
LVKVTVGDVLVVPPGTLPKSIFLGDTLTFGFFASGDETWARATLGVASETAKIRIARAATRRARRFKVLMVFTNMC